MLVYLNENQMLNPERIDYVVKTQSGCNVYIGQKIIECGYSVSQFKKKIERLIELEKENE